MNNQIVDPEGPTVFEILLTHKVWKVVLDAEGTWEAGSNLLLLPGHADLRRDQDSPILLCVERKEYPTVKMFDGLHEFETNHADIWWAVCSTPESLYNMVLEEWMIHSIVEFMVS